MPPDPPPWLLLLASLAPIWHRSSRRPATLALVQGTSVRARLSPHVLELLCCCAVVLSCAARPPSLASHGQPTLSLLGWFDHTPVMNGETVAASLRRCVAVSSVVVCLANSIGPLGPADSRSALVWGPDVTWALGALLAGRFWRRRSCSYTVVPTSTCPGQTPESSVALPITDPRMQQRAAVSDCTYAAAATAPRHSRSCGLGHPHHPSCPGCPVASLGRLHGASPCCGRCR